MKIVHVKEDFGTTTVQQTSSTAQAGKQSSTSNPAAEITVVDDEEGEDMPMLVSVNNGANKSNMVENFKSSSVDSDASKNVEYSNRRRTKIKPDDREISHRRHRRHSSDSEQSFAHLVQKPEQELADAIRLMAEALAANTEALVELRELLANNNAAFEKIANFLELRQKPIPPTKNLVSADEVIKNVKWKSLKYSDCSIFTRDLTVALATNCFFGDSVLKTSSVKRDYPEANIERLDANKMSEIKTIVRQTVQKRSECSDENFELMWSTAVRALQKRCYNLRQNAVRPKT
uniref:BEN domain-containing protein n=1 Tax=Romanomermis culicivorax TaxID=13658 RepID=A0A915IX82_ROMCU